MFQQEIETVRARPGRNPIRIRIHRIHHHVAVADAARVDLRIAERERGMHLRNGAGNPPAPARRADHHREHRRNRGIPTFARPRERVPHAHPEIQRPVRHVPVNCAPELERDHQFGMTVAPGDHPNRVGEPLPGNRRPPPPPRHAPSGRDATPPMRGARGREDPRGDRRSIARSPSRPAPSRR